MGRRESQGFLDCQDSLAPRVILDQWDPREETGPRVVQDRVEYQGPLVHLALLYPYQVASATLAVSGVAIERTI